MPNARAPASPGAERSGKQVSPEKGTPQQRPPTEGPPQPERQPEPQPEPQPGPQPEPLAADTPKQAPATPPPAESCSAVASPRKRPVEDDPEDRTAKLRRVDASPPPPPAVSSPPASPPPPAPPPLRAPPDEADDRPVPPPTAGLEEAHARTSPEASERVPPRSLPAPPTPLVLSEAEPTGAPTSSAGSPATDVRALSPLKRVLPEAAPDRKQELDRPDDGVPERTPRACSVPLAPQQSGEDETARATNPPPTRDVAAAEVELEGAEPHSGDGSEPARPVSPTLVSIANPPPASEISERVASSLSAVPATGDGGNCMTTLRGPGSLSGVGLVSHEADDPAPPSPAPTCSPAPGRNAAALPPAEADAKERKAM